MARAKPDVSPQPDRTRSIQLVDLEKHYSNPDGTLTRNGKEIPRGEMCYFASPMDHPSYIRFLRTTEVEKNGTSTSIIHLSTTMELDLYPVGVKVWVKYDIIKQQYFLMVQGLTDKKPEVLRRWTAKEIIEAPGP